MFRTFSWPATSRVLAASSFSLVPLLAGCALSAEGDTASSTEALRAAPAAACAFGTTYHELNESTAFEPVSSHPVETGEGAAPSLSTEQAAFVLLGIQVHRPEVTTLAEGLASVDDGGLHLDFYRHKKTGFQYVAVEYGLGDNSYGAIFARASANADGVVARIHDGDLEGCTVFEAVPTPKVTYRKLAHTKALKAVTAECLALEAQAGDAFYCPLVDRYKFSGPITEAALGRLVEKRHADAESLQNVSADGAVATLRGRADGQAAGVGDADLRGEIAAVVDRYETLVRNAPGTRILTASGYWAPSVNSDTVFVVDDTDNTVLVVEHGDTDG